VHRDVKFKLTIFILGTLIDKRGIRYNIQFLLFIARSHKFDLPANVKICMRVNQGMIEMVRLAASSQFFLSCPKVKVITRALVLSVKFIK